MSLLSSLFSLKSVLLSMKNLQMGMKCRLVVYIKIFTLSLGDNFQYIQHLPVEKKIMTGEMKMKSQKISKNNWLEYKCPMN